MTFIYWKFLFGEKLDYKDKHYLKECVKDFTILTLTLIHFFCTFTYVIYLIITGIL